MSCIVSVQSQSLFSLAHKATSWAVTGSKQVVLLIVSDFAELNMPRVSGVLLTRHLAASDPSAPRDIAP